MRLTLLTASVAALLAGGAGAETIGVTMQSFDNNFQTLLRHGITDRAAEVGVDVQVEDSQTDVGKQLDQVNNFIASGVDAIVVTLADTSAAPAITSAAEAAGVPLVYVNLEPVNVAELPDNEAYVGSKETDSGRLGAEEACKLLKAQGKGDGAGAYILMGDLAHNAAVMRTQSVVDVLSEGGCGPVRVIDKQVGAWSRNGAMDLMTNWITTGEPFDAVFANNDEMAIGAIQAMKSAGFDMNDVVVVGVDATQDGLAAMQAGELDVTVFQNARGQAAGAVDAALALARGEAVDQTVYIPFELVTPANMEGYLAAN
jgi:ABC-type sugar transport system substrate-binding protein